MKILRTIESFYPFVTGPANQAYMISHLLEKRGIESPIYTTFYNAEDSPAEEMLGNVRVRRFKDRFRFMRYIYTPEIKKDIEKEKPDIIHCHNYRNYQGQAGFNYCRIKDIPFVINTHGSLLGYESITSGINRIPYMFHDSILKMNKIITRADAVIVSSMQEKDEAIRFGADRKKLHVIPMGIDVKEYIKAKRSRDDDGKIRLLFVGRICRDRNLMPILKAFDMLKKEGHDDIELRVVGGAEKRSATEKEGYIDELKRYSEEKKLGVMFTGPKYKDDLKKEYMDADIFVYTSVWENFGQTIMEAAAAGLPVISTKVGIAEEIIEHGKNGFLVEHNKPKEIADNVTKLLEREKRESFGRRIRIKIEDRFNKDRIIMEYEKMYVEVNDI